MTERLSNALVLVGAGKMGLAMLEGWLASGYAPQKIVVYDPTPSETAKAVLQREKIILNPPVETLQEVEVVVIAVKPQILDQVLPSLTPVMKWRPLLLSIAAGKPIATFTQTFGPDASVIRAMPNTPAAIGRGISGMVANANVTSAQVKMAIALLSSIGEVVKLNDESLIDAVTGVSGSGPAYVFYMTECLAKAGEKLGLPPEMAMQLARATVAGAGELMHTTSEDPSVLRHNVTSPNGTTAAALDVLMADDGLQPLIERTVNAATQRSRDLAK